MNSLCPKCRGALRAKEKSLHGLHKPCFEKWFGVTADFEDVAAKKSSSSSGNFSDFNRSFFHGKFKKYSASLGNESYILKVEEKEYPELPATEYLCNQIAALLKIRVPDFYFIKFEGQLDTFVTRNFIYDYAPANLVHIYHYIDDKKTFNCETIIRIIKEKTGRLIDVERFVELILFDSLIGNHDRHGRNLGLIQTAKALELSPFYDNPSYIGTESKALLRAQHEPRGAIATSQTNEPKMIDYVAELSRLGYRESTSKFLKKIEIDSIRNLIEQSLLGRLRRKALMGLIERRYDELREGNEKF